MTTWQLTRPPARLCCPPAISGAIALELTGLGGDADNSATAGCSEERQERLGYHHRRKGVHFQHLAVSADGDQLHFPQRGDAGVVDDAPQLQT